MFVCSLLECSADSRQTLWRPCRHAQVSFTYILRMCVYTRTPLCITFATNKFNLGEMAFDNIINDNREFLLCFDDSVLFNYCCQSSRFLVTDCTRGNIFCTFSALSMRKYVLYVLIRYTDGKNNRNNKELRKYTVWEFVWKQMELCINIYPLFAVLQ